MPPSAILEAWFVDQRDKPLDVVIAGRIFGGRHGEAMQRPREYHFDGIVFRLLFAGTELLAIDAPSDFQRGEFNQLIVPSARQAVFGWHYYGREPIPENWCEETYLLENGWVHLTRTGPLLPGEEDFQYFGDRFVELR